MTTIPVHKKRIQEHLEELQEAINKGIHLRPASIGFHTEACAMDMLELYLHKKKLIDTGKIVKHDWFKRPKDNQKIDPLIERKMPVSFEGREEIYGMFYFLEENRNILMYGNPSIRQIEAVLETFQKLRKILEKKLEEEGETLD